MEYIKYGTYNIPYTIKKSKRKKTLAISISPTAQVIVLSPEFLKKEEIEKLVKKKAQLIIEKQKYFKHLMTLYPNVDKPHSRFKRFSWLLGKKISIKVLMWTSHIQDLKDFLAYLAKKSVLRY